MRDDVERAGRITRFQEALAARGLDGALLLQATDVLYFSGTRQNAALWIPARGAALLLVRKSLARALEEASVPRVERFPRSKELAAALGAPRTVGLTFDVVPMAVHRLYARALPDARVEDVSTEVRTLRSVKSAGELGAMREAGAMLSGVLGEVPSFLRPGLRELDLAAEIELRLRRAGNEGTPRLRGFNLELFVGLALVGSSASAPGFFDGPVTGRGLSAASPIGPSRAIVTLGAPILLDYTAVREGYVVDMTRMAVCGELAPELARAFEVSLRIQDEVASGLVPGAVPSRLWERAARIAAEAGLAACFMGPPGDQATFVGHGVGLELDELPVLAPGFDAPLVEGQTVAVEPKFVFPGVGAVGIENTWAVRSGGAEKITALDDAVLRAPA